MIGARDIWVFVGKPWRGTFYETLEETIRTRFTYIVLFFFANMVLGLDYWLFIKALPVILVIGKIAQKIYEAADDARREFVRRNWCEAIGTIALGLTLYLAWRHCNEHGWSIDNAAVAIAVYYFLLWVAFAVFTAVACLAWWRRPRVTPGLTIIHADDARMVTAAELEERGLSDER